MDDTVFVHMVSFNSEKFIRKAVQSVTAQEGIAVHLHITDNASADGTASLIRGMLGPAVTAAFNGENLGFSAAHNQGVKRFLDGTWSHLLILNPDVSLEPHCLRTLVDAMVPHDRIGLSTPKLFRADDALSPVMPRRLDAAGMELLDSLRHFDRGSELPDAYFQPETVFGGTGACLLLKRDSVGALLLKGEKKDGDKCAVFPQLAAGEEHRAPLFDEAFFAYREDADLSWRANLLGWRCLFVPSAVGYHRRVVLPEQRRSTDAVLNGLSVRNRFLLQLNNYFPLKNSAAMFLSGFLLRNFVVIAAVLFSEWRSLPYLWRLWSLIPRAWERRTVLWKRIHGER